MLSKVKNHLILDTNIFRFISSEVGDNLSDIISIQRRLKNFEKQNNFRFLITYDIIQELLQHIHLSENNPDRLQCQKGLALAILLCSDLSENLDYFFPKDKVIHSLPGFIHTFYEKYSNNENEYCVSKLDVDYFHAIEEFLSALEGKSDLKVSQLDFNLFSSQYSETRNNYVRNVVFVYMDYLVRNNSLLNKTYCSTKPQKKILNDYKNELLNVWINCLVSVLLKQLDSYTNNNSFNKSLKFFNQGISNEYILNFFLQDIRKNEFKKTQEFVSSLSQKRIDRVFDYFILHSIERFKALFYPENNFYLISNDHQVTVQKKKTSSVDQLLVQKMKKWTIYFDPKIDLDSNLKRISEKITSNPSAS